jgi:pyruvate-ferredoxin/flavodoxin oxidoreductase
MTPIVRELQSEGGAADGPRQFANRRADHDLHRQPGLLLMIPNMFKIAGDKPARFSYRRALSGHTCALDLWRSQRRHGDAFDGLGHALFNSIQEVMDFALIAQAATLESRVPFLHVFDGFRTSHEVMKIEELSDEQIRAMIDEQLVRAHRSRALTPDRPVMRGTAQNPDVFFQSRERANSFYTQTPEIVERTMKKFAETTGRQYQLFEYVGAPTPNE